jgi:hypothetical protein
MTRILLTLASISVLLLLAELLIGFSLGDLYAPHELPLDTLRWSTVHRLTGLAAALVVVFVESVIVTYFIGTSRWCKEVVETYQLDRSWIQQSNRLKRQTFPWALAGMLAVVGVISLGAASDPGSRLANPHMWAIWHFVGAIAGVALIAWTYVVAWNKVVANHAIIDQLVAEVRRIRRDRGLDMPQ